MEINAYRCISLISDQLWNRNIFKYKHIFKIEPVTNPFKTVYHITNDNISSPLGIYRASI